MKTGFRFTDYGPTVNFFWRGRLGTVVFNKLGRNYGWRMCVTHYHTCTHFTWWRLFGTIDNFVSVHR